MSRLQVPRLFLRLVAVFLVSVAVAGAALADQTAVVNGINKLFLRRGPGMEFPPFASLSEGSVVEIKAVEGEWAQIVTANGQVGYAQRRYLETGRGETAAATPTKKATKTPKTPKATATPTERRATYTPTQTRSPRPSRTPTEIRPTRTPTEIRREPTGVVAIEEAVTPVAPTAPAAEDPTETPRATETAVADLEASPVDPTPTSERPPATDADIPNELRQLRVAVERLQRRLDELSGAPSGSLPMVDDPQEPSGTTSGGTVLAVLAALGLGWALGSAYARNQERGRRSRIRF